MKATDPVILVCVMASGNYVSCSMSRQMASDEMRIWWNRRQTVRKGGPDRDDCQDWLRHGTIAYNYNVADAKDGTVAGMVVAVEHIIGMYVGEVPPMQSLQERAVKVMEKAVPLMEQEIKDHQHGEEWKTQDPDEESED